jgi:tetratricopeptide (TPR) repeat protein
MTYTLRLTQTTEGQDRYTVEAIIEGGDLPQLQAVSNFDFSLTDQDREDLRWYFEEYLKFPFDPAPKIAARIEKRMNEIGAGLFVKVFLASDEAKRVLESVCARLADTRIEIVTDDPHAESIPWELMQDPITGESLLQRASAFVRVSSSAGDRLRGASLISGRVRILLVICRPGGGTDVPFRSVARHMIRGLSAGSAATFQLDVLRPPTFGRLKEVLSEARKAGQPYSVVHFDGHGFYDDPLTLDSGLPPKKKRGHLVFENASLTGSNKEYIDGQRLGPALAEAEVSLLVMNACRSAHAEPLLAPTATAGEAETRVPAYGSLAQEVLAAGVPGVVAMRYNVYVTTAAQFVSHLYAGLAEGVPLGEAATQARKKLRERPPRTLLQPPRPGRDWVVPVVYEAPRGGLSLAPLKDTPRTVDVETNAPALITDARADGLPEAPAAGFLGRDETLLALDRGFDNNHVALLHALAGSGKTAAAVEFARWYVQTDGVRGPALFTSFEYYKPLTRVLDQLAQTFARKLKESGINWLVLSDGERRALALELLSRFPVLWVWDNVEPVTGFPSGTASAWSAAEQQELAAFLREAGRTKAKFLLTSRRDERDWLRDLPVRVTLPPMPMEERVQMLVALAEARGQSLTGMEDWLPLLRFTQGNPLTLTVLIGEALRAGLKTGEEIEALVSRLRAGEAAFEDEADGGRPRSLAASLDYGFEHAFSEEERRQLALLHFFQGHVNVITFCSMGHTEYAAWLTELQGMTPDECAALFRRAAEVGMLAPHHKYVAVYSSHPALPWYFKKLFDRYYPPPAGEAHEVRATRAFVQAMSVVGTHLMLEYTHGKRNLIDLLSVEEANLLHASDLALRLRWWDRVIGVVQGLAVLYERRGRWTEWLRLVERLRPNFVDPTTDGPLAGLEEVWSAFTSYRIRLARQARDLALAERLQRARLEWDRQRAAPILTAPPGTLDDAQRQNVTMLISSLSEMGDIERELRKPRCKETYEEAYRLWEWLGGDNRAFIIAFNLGNAYWEVPALRNLELAEEWYGRCEKLRDKGDVMMWAQCQSQRGIIAYVRAMEMIERNGREIMQALAAGEPYTGDLVKQAEEYNAQLENAESFSVEALQLFPPDASRELAIVNNTLGLIYKALGKTELAVAHYIETARLAAGEGNHYLAAAARQNVASAWLQAGGGRLQDALEYAEAALHDYESYGERASQEAATTKELIAEIKRRLPEGSGG